MLLSRFRVPLLIGPWCALALTSARAQSPEPPFVEWQRRYGGSGEDQAWSIRETREGGYILAGSTDSFGDDGLELYLLKLDRNGAFEWQSHLPGLVRANQVEETPDGYVVAGWREPLGGGAALLSAGADGELLTAHLYSEGKPGSLNSVTPADGGGYVAAGYLGSFSDGTVTMYVVRADPALNVVWERTFEDIQAIAGGNVIRSRDGNYVAVGRTHDNETGEERMCLVALDGEGKVIWKNTTLGNPGSGYNEGQAVFESEQGFVILGGTIPFPDSTPGLHIAEVDGQGKELWQKSFPGASNEESFDAITKSANGDYVIVEQRGVQLRVARIFPRGGISSSVTFDGQAGGHAVIESADGGLVIAGEATSPASGKDVLVVKLLPKRLFIRGDANHDSEVDLSDGVFILLWLYLGGPAPVCGDAADANDDSQVDISDAASIFQFLFLDDRRSWEPYPHPGMDPTPDFLGCDVEP
jgi:hypothetical protein